MAGLFSSRFADFGASHYRPPELPPTCDRITGSSADRLRNKVREHVPKVPGVYGWIDRHGTLLYIGKAKSLRSRLMSYFRASSDHKAGKLVQRSSRIVWEQAPSEFAALLRELELIQRFVPRFNVQGIPGRQRCSYVCIGRGPVPYAFVSRQPTGKEIACYGPVREIGRAHEAVRKLNHYFGLRDCSQRQPLRFADQPELFALDRAPGCIRYELQTCLGPCVAACTGGEYHAAVRSMQEFLEGRNLEPLEKITAQMKHASLQQEFERAAALRDKANELTWLLERLTWLRQARDRQSFVYASTGTDMKTVWYLTHRGQVRATLYAPTDDVSRAQMATTLSQVFQLNEPISGTVPLRQIDHILLISGWFRKYPLERDRLLSIPEAMERCQPAVTAGSATPG